MSKRLQVLIDEDELEAMKRLASEHGVTLAEWVRQTLRSASARQPSTGVDRKLAHVRAALRHCFPAPPIDQMLEEISRGYEAVDS